MAWQLNREKNAKKIMTAGRHGAFGAFGGFWTILQDFLVHKLLIDVHRVLMCC